MMGVGSCRHSSCLVLYLHFAMGAIVLLFLCRVIHELGDCKWGSIGGKEGLNRKNKSFEKTIKLRADILHLKVLSCQ